MKIHSLNLHAYQATQPKASLTQPKPEADMPQDGFTPSEPEDSIASRALKGALIGGAVGLILPGVIVPIVGFAASPITGPLGAVLGAYAGAVDFFGEQHQQQQP